MRVIVDSACPIVRALLAAWSVWMASIALGASSPADDQAPAVTRQQIQADWLRQDVVRNLPPSPRHREPDRPTITPQQDAAGGNDGLKNGTYGFHTANDENPWWQVDLGQPTLLDRVVIFNRCDGNVGGRAAGLIVLVSADGQAWNEHYQHDGTAFGGCADGKPLVIPAAGTRAQLVRIQLPGRQYLHLDEVEVFSAGHKTNIALGKPADQSSTSSWSTASLPERADHQSPSDPTVEPVYPIQEVIQRSLKLADDLGRMGADVGPQLKVLEQVASREAKLPQDAPPSARRDLYFQARWAQRHMTLANPLVDFDRILLVKRIPGTFTHMSDQYYGWWSRPGGGLYVLEDLKSGAPRLRALSNSFPPGSFLRPDISYDGDKALFAYCKYYPGLREESNKLDKNNVPEDAFYHLYEMNMDGTGARRLTHGRYDNFDGRYLPSGEIVFLSTRRGQYVQCGKDSSQQCLDGQAPDCYVRCGGGPERPVAVYTLHVLSAEGSNLRQISPFEMFEWTPSVDPHGRILYARWDYVDRHNMPYMSLWSTMPDGTGAQALFGNFTTNPHCVFEARAIPASEKLIFTASGHHANTGGSLVLLDYHRASDGPEAMTRLTPEVAFPETEGWPMSYFANPYPLSENHYLVAWSDREMIGWPGPPEPENAFGIYLYDAFGNLTLVYRDPAISSMTPIPIRPRVHPPTLPDHVAWDAGQTGRMLLVDVYRGLDEIPRGTIRALRLVGVPVKTHPTMNFPSIGVTRDDPGKFVLGTVPVDQDGSAYFHVPSGVPIFLQALDADGMAVQTMRSATYVQPGHTTTCIGCHEPRNSSPPSLFPMAARRQPSKITPGPDGSWPFDYAALVQPVLDQHCVECHRPGTDGAAWDLTPAKSYDTLLAYGTPSLRDHVLERYNQGRSTPGACAASRSALVGLLKTGHYQVAPSPDAWDRLITWIDTYGQRQGSFSDDQARRLTDLRAAMAAVLKRRP